MAVILGRDTMKIPRITIARCLGWIAVIAANLALIQSMGVLGELEGCPFILIALQVGLWGLIRSRGRLRRFWAGFLAPCMAAVLVLLLCPSPPLDRLMTPYTDIADELEVTYLPTTLAGSLGNELWGLHLAVVYFVPVFVAALLGGMIAAWLIPRSLEPTRTVHREKPASLTG
jgi:hypothetical protein